VEKQAGAKTSKHVTNTCISPRKLIKGSPNPIIAMSQRLESYYSKVDVWNPIITKRDVWSPIIANFSPGTHELSQLTDTTPVRETKHTRVFLVTNAAEPIAHVSWLVFILWTRQLLQRSTGASYTPGTHQEQASIPAISHDLLELLNVAMKSGRRGLLSAGSTPRTPLLLTA
jgi:hypothetical protein